MTRPFIESRSILGTESESWHVIEGLIASLSLQRRVGLVSIPPICLPSVWLSFGWICQCSAPKDINSQVRIPGNVVPNGLPKLQTEAVGVDLSG